MTLKTVLALHPAHREDIGDLVTRAPMQGPQSGVSADPFIFLAHHGPQIYPPNNRGLPFGPHPHRGFETVTFILDGELTHSDSFGHVSNIKSGGVQWMTAGAGIEHAELSPDAFKRAGGPLEILQLWVNLPRRLKFAKPRYQGLQRDAIPVIEADGGKARVQLISGEWQGIKGPVDSITGNFMTTVEANAGAKLSFGGLEGRSIFFYLVSGAAHVNGRDVSEHHLAQFSHSGDEVVIEATSDARILFGHGDPIREPIVAHGPFVMNTVDEIRQAITDYQSGKFGFVRDGRFAGPTS
jgi:quercetin 2,3-dioxygenase